MRPQNVKVALAQALPKMHKEYVCLPKFHVIIDIKLSCYYDIVSFLKQRYLILEHLCCKRLLWYGQQNSWKFNCSMWRRIFVHKRTTWKNNKHNFRLYLKKSLITTQFKKMTLEKLLKIHESVQNNLHWKKPVVSKGWRCYHEKFVSLLACNYNHDRTRIEWICFTTFMLKICWSL